jgi:hypothetical protein
MYGKRDSTNFRVFSLRPGRPRPGKSSRRLIAVAMACMVLAAFLAVARWIWLTGLRHYSGASA